VCLWAIYLVVRSFLTSRVQVTFFGHLPSLCLCSLKHAASQSWTLVCAPANKMNETPCIRVTVTQLHIAPVSRILMLPHAVPPCHKWHHTCLPLLLHIKGSSPHPIACQLDHFAHSRPPWFLLGPWLHESTMIALIIHEMQANKRVPSSLGPFFSRRTGGVWRMCEHGGSAQWQK